VGSKASINPPVHAQSAGDQNTALELRFFVAVEAKPVLAGHKTTQVADERAVGNQRTLGVAGGAAGVDEHCGFLGQGVHQLKHGGLCRQNSLKAGILRAGQQSGVCLLQAHTQDRAQLRGKSSAHAGQRWQRAGIANGDDRFTVLASGTPAASGPNNMDKGMATAPSCSTAM